MDKAIWIEWFVLHLGKLRPRESSRILADLAYEVYPHLGHLDPIDVAQREFDAPPPHRVDGTDWPKSMPLSGATAAPALDGAVSETAAAHTAAAKVAPSVPGRFWATVGLVP